MKEKDLDKYIHFLVEITDIDNFKYKGILYKIVNHKFKINNVEEIASINKGYILDSSSHRYSFRKSHIKNILDLRRLK